MGMTDLSLEEIERVRREQEQKQQQLQPQRGGRRRGRPSPQAPPASQEAAGGEEEMVPLPARQPQQPQQQARKDHQLPLGASAAAATAAPVSPPSQRLGAGRAGEPQPPPSGVHAPEEPRPMGQRKFETTHLMMGLSNPSSSGHAPEEPTHPLGPAPHRGPQQSNRPLRVPPPPQRVPPPPPGIPAGSADACTDTVDTNAWDEKNCIKLSIENTADKKIKERKNDDTTKATESNDDTNSDKVDTLMQNSTKAVGKNESNETMKPPSQSEKPRPTMVKRESNSPSVSNAPSGSQSRRFLKTIHSYIRKHREIYCKHIKVIQNEQKEACETMKKIKQMRSLLAVAQNFEQSDIRDNNSYKDGRKRGRGDKSNDTRLTCKRIRGGGGEKEERYIHECSRCTTKIKTCVDDWIWEVVHCVVDEIIAHTETGVRPTIIRWCQV